MQNEIVKYAFRGQTEGIEVKPLDFLRKSRTLTERIHRTDFYQLLYVTDGELHLTIDFENIVLQMGACVVIAPGQVCSFDSSGAYDGWAVLFTAEFFAETPFDTSFFARFALVYVVGRAGHLLSGQNFLRRNSYAFSCRDAKTAGPFAIHHCPQLFAHLLVGSGQTNKFFALQLS